MICADGYAIRVPDGIRFAGAYLPCEQFDSFMHALEAGKFDEAEALLVTKPKVRKGSVPKGTHREANPECYVPEQQSQTL